MSLVGNIHSIESCGTVDGPGVRFVVFLQGCPLRCQYCHNPDTWAVDGGRTMSVQALIDEIIKYKSYMRFSNGGVTISGGEPLIQTAFVLELLKACKAKHIHTAIDTSGFIFTEDTKAVIDAVDLVLLDVKHADPKTYKVITGVNLQPTLDFLAYLHKQHKPTWVRYVLVPTLSDQPEHIETLSKILSNYNNIERIEILPFHKMGEYKWASLGLTYQLTNIDEPSKDSILKAMTIFKKYNLHVVTS